MTEEKWKFYICDHCGHHAFPALWRVAPACPNCGGAQRIVTAVPESRAMNAESEVAHLRDRLHDFNVQGLELRRRAEVAEWKVESASSSKVIPGFPGLSGSPDASFEAGFDRGYKRGEAEAEARTELALRVLDAEVLDDEDPAEAGPPRPEGGS